MQQSCENSHCLCKCNNIAVVVLRNMKLSRNTTAKTAIQELVLSSKSALLYTEIQKQLIELCDRVTIYRVLDRLTDEGLIHKAVNVDGVVKYADFHSCSERHNHNHIQGLK